MHEESSVLTRARPLINLPIRGTTPTRARALINLPIRGTTATRARPLINLPIRGNHPYSPISSHTPFDRSTQIQLKGL